MTEEERRAYSTVHAAMTLARCGVERTPAEENRCRLYASAFELLLKTRRG